MSYDVDSSDHVRDVLLNCSCVDVSRICSVFLSGYVFYVLHVSKLIFTPNELVRESHSSTDN